MTPTRRSSSLFVALVVALAALPMAAHGALIGSVATEDGSVIGGGDWITDVSLGWSIAEDGGNYLYSYTFEAPDPGLSHFILQASDSFTGTNILGISASGEGGYELGTFSDAQGQSNPEMPAPLFGIKFEEFAGAELEVGTSWTFWLLSDRAPMEGDFYANGGSGSYAYNSGFGDPNGAKIMVPDTETHPVPEPGTLLLLGSGLIGVAAWGRRRSWK